MFGSNGQSSGTLRNPSRHPSSLRSLESSERLRTEFPPVQGEIVENEFIRTLGSSQIHELSALDPGRAQGPRRFVVGRAAVQVLPRFPRGRVTGPVRFFTKLIEIWHLDTNDACALLGYELQDRQYVEDILAGSITLRGRDTKDRIATLFRIHSLLSGLFRSLDVENEWLRESREALGGRRPIELLQNGSMEGLLTLKQLIERGAGL